VTEATLEAVLASPWLLGVLLVMVIVDGPFPFLPSEPILFAAAARALGAGDVPMLAGLVAAAILGSLLGDLLLFGLGRTSRRLVPEGRGRAIRWVHRHVHARPIVALAAVRIVPGGRLASVTAAGRVDLPGRRFLPATVVSSVVWTGYMTGVGVGLAGLTDGDPLWSLVASVSLGALVAALTSLAGRVLSMRRALPA
jgi:membrane-associated protein